jgi:hypothetical protein
MARSFAAGRRSIFGNVLRRLLCLTEHRRRRVRITELAKRVGLLGAIILALLARPAKGQAGTAKADAPGIPTIAPVIEAVDGAVVNMSAMSERPAQVCPLFRDLFFQPFLPSPYRLPPERRTSAGSGAIRPRTSRSSGCAWPRRRRAGIGGHIGHRAPERLARWTREAGGPASLTRGAGAISFRRGG